jgi:hypothetical protein
MRLTSREVETLQILSIGNGDNLFIMHAAGEMIFIPNALMWKASIKKMETVMIR